MRTNTSIITKSKLLIYSNKKWIAFKGLLVIDYGEIEDLLSKIKIIYINPSLIISFLFQNQHLVLLYGCYDNDKKNTLDTLNSFNSKLLTQTTDYSSIQELSGYSIHSLLFGGMKNITKDSYLYYENFGAQYYCKPYVFTTLSIANSNLEKLIDILAKQRLIITFSSINDLSLFHISLFFFETTKKEIQDSVKMVKQKLIEIPNIKGQLISLKKNQLSASPTKSMSGLNDITIELNSMFKWLLNFKLTKKNNLMSYPKIMYPKQVKTGTRSMELQIDKNQLKSVLAILEYNNWTNIETKPFKKFEIVKLSNQSVNLILVLGDKSPNVHDNDFTSVMSKGINLVLFSLNGNLFFYDHGQIID